MEVLANFSVVIICTLIIIVSLVYTHFSKDKSVSKEDKNLKEWSKALNDLIVLTDKYGFNERMVVFCLQTVARTSGALSELMSLSKEDKDLKTVGYLVGELEKPEDICTVFVEFNPTALSTVCLQNGIDEAPLHKPIIINNVSQEEVNPEKESEE